jgi:hypothetical protein
VALSDWKIPIRLDSDSGPPDLKWIGWTGLHRTCSVKLLDLDSQIQIGRLRFKVESSPGG